MASRSAASTGETAVITPETYKRLERARERLRDGIREPPSWYELARRHKFSRPTVTKIKQAGEGKKKTIQLGTAQKLASALKSSIPELFLVPERPKDDEAEVGTHIDDAELNSLIDEASIPGRHHALTDGLAVKQLAETITIHPKGHPGAIDLIRTLLDVASTIRIAGEGPATPEKMMRQIWKMIAPTHPLHGARTAEQAIGELLRNGKAKSGPISKPKIPIEPKKPPRDG